MSRKPETTFIASVHKHLPKDLYRLKNNNPFAGGIADVWYSGMKADLWVEYKFVARVPKTGLAADLGELQKVWLTTDTEAFMRSSLAPRTAGSSCVI